MADPSDEGLRADVAVVGAGAAGLFAALIAARAGAAVALISAAPLARTASYWAQGGIAAALAADDSPARHLEDTASAGRGAVRRSAADVLCREVAARVFELERFGVDAVRLAMSFAGPPEDDIDWKDVSPTGAQKFLARAWRLSKEPLAKPATDPKPGDGTLRRASLIEFY